MGPAQLTLLHGEIVVGREAFAHDDAAKGVTGRFHIRRLVQSMLDHQRGDRRDLDHLMAQRRWILALQQSAAATACLGVMLHHFVNAPNRQQSL